jgi:hypothetical protein
MVKLHPIHSMTVQSRLIRCWPGDALGCGSDVTSAWLSVYNEMVLPIVAGVFSRIQRASIAPIASALYVLCLSGLPICT